MVPRGADLKHYPPADLRQSETRIRQMSASAERRCDGHQRRQPWMLALMDRSPSGNGVGPPVPAVYRGTEGKPEPVLFTPRRRWRTVRHRAKATLDYALPTANPLAPIRLDGAKSRRSQRANMRCPHLCHNSLGRRQTLESHHQTALVGPSRSSLVRSAPVILRRLPCRSSSTRDRPIRGTWTTPSSRPE